MNDSRNAKKIAKLSGTRWLARYSAISTVLDQWEELCLLISLAQTEDKCYTAEQLHGIMICPAFKAYLVFLRNILKSVCETNAMFQGENVESLKLFEDLLLLYKSMLKKIVVPNILQKVPNDRLVEFNFMEHIMHTTIMYFGCEFDQIANTMSKEDLNNVILKIINRTDNPIKSIIAKNSTIKII